MVVTQSHRGLRDWVVQRITAVIVGIYAVAIIIYFLTQPAVDVVQWHALFGHWWMKAATLLALLSILWHAWIGLWTVATDYLHNKAVRTIFLLVVLLLLLGYLVWTIAILWGHV